jgi:hypothetical protein
MRVTLSLGERGGDEGEFAVRVHGEVELLHTH